MGTIAERGIVIKANFINIVPAPSATKGSEALLTLHLSNYKHIVKAYGQRSADAAIAHLRDVVLDHFHEKVALVSDSQDSIGVRVLPSRMLGGVITGEVCERWVETICYLGSMSPVATPQGVLHLVLSGSWSLLSSISGVESDECPHGTVHGRFSGQSVAQNDLWVRRYRADMEAAVCVLTAVDLKRDGWARAQCGAVGTYDQKHAYQLVLDWLAVRDAKSSEQVVFYGAQPHLMDGEGRKRDLLEERQALERIGLVGLLDGYLVSEVLNELETYSDVVLGVSISAQSVCDSSIWRDIKSRLAANPEAAKRLIITITETTMFPDIAEATRFVSVMRRLGCVIALADFGSGYAAIRQIMALAPDIVRIGQFFVEWATKSPADQDLFVHLVGLASALASNVIIDGVRTVEQSQLALHAGASWQQGSLWGEPGSTRVWHFSETAKSHRSHLGLPVTSVKTMIKDTTL